ncbi:MAG TPA: ATP-dependent Clp protease ATP-binding subunit ClpX, partial [Bacteroidales bacterium]|nr:ATP-dependent Clp protease ATP-binding subunit ClpX [Bacteroidales bacterium]
IVDKSIEFRLGARGLRSILEAIMTDAMFELPSDKSIRQLNVTAAYAEEKLRKTNLSRLKVA